ncbi:MAG TPA: glycosyltransferase family 4 protein, partial [Thermoanaerobaculia bacterium]|nr:glycosyltransferase family 4 protein [Thermoanaerobaculia bacterium]
TYTPLRTDEPGVAIERVFFGALNVYLKQIAPPLRRGWAGVERLLDRPGLVALVSRLGSATDPGRLGELTLSILRGEEGNQASELDKLVSWLRDSFRPEVVHLTNSMFAGFARRLKAELGVPVVCSVQGEELFLDGLREPSRGAVRAALAERAQDIDLFVAPSRFYADLMASYLQVERGRLAVVPLGLNLSGHGAGGAAGHGAGHDSGPGAVRGAGEPWVVGYLGRIAPEKGLDLVAAAFRRLADALGGAGRVRLHVAGYLPPQHRGYLRAVERQLRSWGLAGDYRYAGEVTREEKIAFLAGLDLLAVGTVYPEPKGLYVLEALANGVPVVAPRHGAFPELLAETGGGVLVAPGDPAALAAALAELLRDPGRRERLGRAGREAVHARHGDEAMAAATLGLYQGLVQGRLEAAALGG